MDQKIFQDLIKPYVQHYDATHNRYFYFDPITNNSIWELPPDINEKLNSFYQMYQHEKQNETEKDQENKLQYDKQQGTNENEEHNQIAKAVKNQLQKEKQNEKKLKQQNQNEESESDSPSSEKKSLSKRTDKKNQQRNNSRSRSRSKSPPLQQINENNNDQENQNSQIDQKISQEEAMKQFLEQQIGEVPQSTLEKYITKSQQDQLSRRGEQDVSRILMRPSRKQIEQSLADKYAYKEGDQEYNIWYGRHLSDTRDTVRDHKTPAETRCDSELDSGYTKADLTDRFNAYFCHHWAKGCCSEGQYCKYFHRVPVLAECLSIDNSRDIFGRQRHDKHREDRGGVGSFMFDTRSLEIKDFKAPTEGIGLITQIEWGDIEDIRYLPNQGRAIVRYMHRCMAEYAKESMQHQSLDSGEVINIKWFLEHTDDQNQEKYRKEHFQQLKRVLEKKQHDQQMLSKAEENNQKKQQKMEKRQQYLNQKKSQKEQQLMQQNLQYMNQVFGDEDENDENQISGSNKGSRSNSRESRGSKDNDTAENEKKKAPLSYPTYGAYTDYQQQHVAAYYEQQKASQQYYAQYYQNQLAQGNQVADQPLEFKKKK